MTIIWSVRGKLLRNAVCCVVYDSCAQWFCRQMWTFYSLHSLGFFYFFCVQFGILFFRVYFAHLVFVLLYFDVLVFLTSVPSQEVGWGEQLWNDLFIIKWDLKPFKPYCGLCGFCWLFSHCYRFVISASCLCFQIMSQFHHQQHQVNKRICFAAIFVNVLLMLSNHLSLM